MELLIVICFVCSWNFVHAADVTVEKKSNQKDERVSLLCVMQISKDKWSDFQKKSSKLTIEQIEQAVKTKHEDAGLKFFEFMRPGFYYRINNDGTLEKIKPKIRTVSAVSLLTTLGIAGIVVSCIAFGFRWFGNTLSLPKLA